MNLIKYDETANSNQGNDQRPEVNVQTLEQFNEMLNREPEAYEVQVNAMANNSKYIPIGFLYMKMDKIFIGLWKTSNFRYQVIVNELVGTITLEYYHPFAKTWITREGSASVMIMQSKGAAIDDVTKKIKNTLQKDLPHLKASCEASAMKTIGKAFGRDLNRDEDKTEEYEKYYTDIANAESAKDAIDWTKVKTVADLQKIWTEHKHLQANKNFRQEFQYRKAQLSNPNINKKAA